jgi:hypothetical protein
MTAFGKRSHDASTAGRHQLGRSFLFLCRVCELPFKPDSVVEPLGPDLHPQVVSIGLFEPAERRGEPAFAIAHMVENLLMLGSGNVPMYATYCAEMAGAAEKNAMWHLARGFWELAAKWYRRGDDPMAQNEPMRRAAETYIQESVDALKREAIPHGIASSFLGRAIQALRQVPGSESRRTELHVLMLEYQKIATGGDRWPSSFTFGKGTNTLKKLEKMRGNSVLKAVL